MPPEQISASAVPWRSHCIWTWWCFHWEFHCRRWRCRSQPCHPDAWTTWDSRKLESEMRRSRRSLRKSGTGYRCTRWWSVLATWEFPLRRSGTAGCWCPSRGISPAQWLWWCLWFAANYALRRAPGWRATRIRLQLPWTTPYWSIPGSIDTTVIAVAGIWRGRGRLRTPATVGLSDKSVCYKLEPGRQRERTATKKPEKISNKSSESLRKNQVARDNE